MKSCLQAETAAVATREAPPGAREGWAKIADRLTPVNLGSGVPAPAPHELLGAFDEAGTPHPILLESGTDTGGRYSIASAAPSALLRLGPECEDPFAELECFVAEPGLHVVSLAYELGRRVEVLPGRARDEIGLPWLWCARYPSAYIHDGTTGEGWLAGGGEIEAALKRARPVEPPPPPRCGTPRSSLDAGEFKDAVRQVQRYLHAGDAYQINLTRQLRFDIDARPIDLYQRLRHQHPVRYGAYVGLGDGAALISNSPERLLARHGDRALSEPIKGTRRRDGNRIADQAAQAALSADPKERAEHTMIVDLVRNDLGRVARAGRVSVSSLRRIESLPTLHHLVSTVEAELPEGLGLAALLRAVFPGGSVTGAPKKRAMEIIDELEPVARGTYCGALGWITGGGRHLDLNLPIRTATLCGGEAFFSVGGGIVVDSRPEAELEETRLKAAGFLGALGIRGEV